MEREVELRHLSKADQHLADAECRVTGQEIVLEKLRLDGHDTSRAEKTLNAFKATLEAMRQHRATIIETIDLIDRGLTHDTLRSGSRTNSRPMR